MPTITINQIRTAIVAAQANWEAGETAISKYADSPGNGLFGLRIRESERVQMMSLAEAATPLFEVPAPPPVAVDWRTHLNCNWVTSIKDQGNCGACVAFATCAVLESRLRLLRSDCQLDVNLSEADLFYCGCGLCCDSGWDFIPALAYCQSHGIGKESDFPYLPGNRPCVAIPPVIETTGVTTHVTLTDRKSAIAADGPVLGGMRVYEDFLYYKSGVYRHVGGVFRGLHAVAIIGYDDARSCWIAKNSWGTGWGMAGFFEIGYGEAGLDNLYPYYGTGVLDINTSGVYS